MNDITIQNQTMTPMEALQKAIKHFGGMNKLSAKLGIHRMAISQWEYRDQVPASRAKEIELLSNSNIAAWQLRPDLFDPPENSEEESTVNDLTTPTQTMSSLEIAELTGKRHDHVMRDIEKILTEAGIDAPRFGGIYTDKRNRQKNCYNLPRRECDLIVSGYSVPYRLKIIDRWHQLEAKQQTTQQKFDIPQTLPDALQLAADLAKKVANKDQLLIATNEASIKAGEILIREFVKAHDFIHIGEKQMYQWMKQQNIIMPTREPYQQYVDRDYFTWKPTQEEHGGRFRYTLRITPRGKVWLATKYMAHLENELEMA